MRDRGKQRDTAKCHERDDRRSWRHRPSPHPKDTRLAVRTASSAPNYPICQTSRCMHIQIRRIPHNFLPGIGQDWPTYLPHCLGHNPTRSRQAAIRQLAPIPQQATENDKAPSIQRPPCPWNPPRAPRVMIAGHKKAKRATPPNVFPSSPSSHSKTELGLRLYPS
jgi:hypothetical protein